MALLIKWWWRFLSNERALWVKVIQSIHGTSGRDTTSILSSKKPGTWRNIVKTGGALIHFNLNMEDFFTRSDGRENNTRLQNDRRDDMLDGHAERVTELQFLLQNMSFTDRDGAWKWVGDVNGHFTVKSLRMIIDNIVNSPHAGICFWNDWLPPRVNCFIWRSLLKRLPTRLNLRSRGVILPVDTCPLCERAGESIEHFFSFLSMCAGNMEMVFKVVRLKYGAIHFPGSAAICHGGSRKDKKKEKILGSCHWLYTMVCLESQKQCHL